MLRSISRRRPGGPWNRWIDDVGAGRGSAGNLELEEMKREWATSVGRGQGPMWIVVPQGNEGQQHENSSSCLYFRIYGDSLTYKELNPQKNPSDYGILKKTMTVKFTNTRQRDSCMFLRLF